MRCFGAILLSLLAACGNERRPVDSSLLIGSRLPLVTLITNSGQATATTDLVKGHALVVVMRGADCLSCGNLPLEARILKNRYPHLQTVFIGSGRDTSELNRFFKIQRLPYYRDYDESFVRAYGLVSTPVLMLVGDSQRILFADIRPGSMSSQFPISRVVESIFGLEMPAADGAAISSAGTSNTLSWGTP